MVGRNLAFVAPPDVPRAPVEFFLGEPLVDGAGRRAAGERNAKRPRRAGALGDPAGGKLA
jgi:hypothetical protein